MVIVKIWGGLGNQLFQYAFGKYLAIKLNTTVKYDVQTINKIKGFTQRNLQLSNFNIQLEIATAAEISKFKKFSNSSFARLERKAAQVFPSIFKNYFVEPVWPVVFQDTALKDNCYYDGYWQSYKYLTVNEQVLKTELRLRNTASQNVKDLLLDIDATNSVSIHVRRGDYLTLASFEVCSMDYYHSAILEIEKKFSAVNYFIFTDDLSWCKENFIGPKFKFVCDNQPFEDLFLMASCKHNIIANSTFSWWAAWCNDHPGKSVISPANWHKRNEGNYGDLLPKSWLKID